MPIPGEKRNTLLFFAFLLLGGVMYLLNKTEIELKLTNKAAGGSADGEDAEEEEGGNG